MVLLEEIDVNEKINKNQLRDLVKSEAQNLHMKDIMLASSFLREDAKYMPASYRKDFIERFSKAFFNNVDTQNIVEFLKVIERQGNEAKGNNERCFVRIAMIISIYTTFVREKPIHPVGTKFPGGFILHKEKGKYLCPVKKRQLTNPSAFCGFCVSVQDESAL